MTVKQVTTSRYDARRRGLPATLTDDQWAYAIAFFGCACAYCGTPFTAKNKPTMEHITPLADPASPGSVAPNCIPACFTCNNAKASRPFSKWVLERFGATPAARILARIASYQEMCGHD